MRVQQVRAAGRVAGLAIVGTATAVLVVAGAPAALAAPLPSPPDPVTTRISQSSTGVPGNGKSLFANVSADGRYVVFRSDASNLVPSGDNPALRDVFLRDRVTGAVELISATKFGNSGNGHSGGVSSPVTPDGRFVSFDSLASNFVAGDANGAFDVFVRARGPVHRITRVSVGAGGVEGNGASFARGISADGRHVLFASEATNLVPGDTNGKLDLFVRDTASGRTVRVSVSSTGDQADEYISDAQLSADGRVVVFGSPATNLVPGDTNGTGDVFVHDVATRRTERISGAGGGSSPSISADGRYVAFSTFDGSYYSRILVRDRATGATIPVSVGELGEPNSSSLTPSISASGRYVAFVSFASNLVPGDTNNTSDIFVRDLVTRRTWLASISTTGAQADRGSFKPAMSESGVAFQSIAGNLVPPPVHGLFQIYFRTL